MTAAPTVGSDPLEHLDGPRRRAERTAWHEAGHVAAYLAYRRPFRYVTIRGRSGADGRVCVRPRRIDSVTLVVIAHAGPMAEGLHALASLPAGYLDEEGLDEGDVIAGAYLDGGHDDVAVIREAGLAEATFPEGLARDLLRREWPVVALVAAALIDHHTLSYRQVLGLPGMDEATRA